MLHPRLICCLDVADGAVTKCVRFDSPRILGDPVAFADAYARGGADELVLLDIGATVQGRTTMLDVVRRVADVVDLPFTVGGGLRTLRDAAAFLEAGADRVALNTAALATPGLVGDVAARYGAQAVVVAIDVRAGEVVSHAGTRPTGRDAVAWAAEAASRGAGELLVTSIDADGTRDGYDLALTGAVARAVKVPVIASGGAGSAAHVAAVLELAQAALVASIVHDDPAGLPALRDELRRLGVPLRPDPVATRA